MLTLSEPQRAELWDYTEKATKAVADQPGAPLALPFKKYGETYYIVGFAALHVGAVLREMPAWLTFETAPEGAKEQPVLAINAALLPWALPSALRVNPPVALFPDDERPAASVEEMDAAMRAMATSAEGRQA